MVRDITHQGKERRMVGEGGGRRKGEGRRKREEGSRGEAMFTLLKTVLL